MALEVIQRPYLSSVLPLSIFNLATVEELSVTGEGFESLGPSLKCRLSGSGSTPAHLSRTGIFVSRNRVICPVDLAAALSRANFLQLSVSNDDGETWSENVLEIHLPSELPRILKQVSPRLIFAG